MYPASLEYSEENLGKMKQFEAHVKKMLSDEEALIQFIADNNELIEWE